MRYWWPVNLAELARLQQAVRKKLEPVAETGRIVTFSAVALWGGSLPRVAVPVIDRLVEHPERLQAMALAVVLPDAAAERAIADWREVLRDLAGADRERPPIVRAGLTMLADVLSPLAGAVGTPAAKRVADAIAELEFGYAGRAAREELPDDAVKGVKERVDRLGTAVGRVLPDVKR